MAKYLNLLIRFYSALLRLYPRRFRAEFEDEMRTVFSTLIEQAVKQGILALAGVILREWLHAPLAILRMHWFSWKKNEKATSDSSAGFLPVHSSFLPPPSPDGRASWIQAGLEVSLFLFMGAILVVQTYLPLDWTVSGPLRNLGSIGPAIILVSGTPFLVGLTRGLPRWAYPFGGILLGYVFLAAIRFAMVPLLAVFLSAFILLAVAAVVVHSQYRPLSPSLQRLGQSIGLDWTRLSFCIYGAMPLIITVAFDDGRCDDRTPWLAISVLLTVAGTFAYSRSRRAVLQMTALLSGMSLSFCCALLDQATFMSGLTSWVTSPASWLAETGWVLRLWASMMALIAAPFLIGLAHRALTPGRTTQAGGL
jgi:hypothetical protein